VNRNAARCLVSGHHSGWDIPDRLPAHRIGPALARDSTCRFAYGLPVTATHSRLKSALREFAAVGGTIGRNSDNDWVLPDDHRYVSSRHAMIEHQSGAWYLVDTSRNGVYINDADMPVGKGHPQRLFDGDRLRIGAYEIAVDISESSEDEQHDGMRDSIVRAQLVPEEESLELALVSEDKMLGDVGLQQHFMPNSALVQKLDSLPSRPGKAATAAAVKGPATGCGRTAGKPGNACP
jgi:type VI secretion system FHA domain protein